MPWKVAKRNGKFGVFKEGPDGQPMGDALGMHDSEDEAMAQMRALYASEGKKSAVKFAEGSEVDLSGLLAPYGGPFFNGRDVSGEFFSAKTDFVLDLIPSDRPLLYHHGLDTKAGLAVVGRIKALSRDEAGLWMKAQLDAASDYYGAIKELVKQGKLGLSSGSMRHLVRMGKSGEILRWPLIEGSLTPTPANPLAEVAFTAIKSHFASIGAELPAKLAESLDAGGGFLTSEDYSGRLVQKEAAGKASPMAMMRRMAKKMDMEMSEAEMARMAEGMDADMPEAEMEQMAREKLLAKRQEMGGKAAKMAMAMMMGMMREMMGEMGMEMSEAQMRQMMADMPSDMPPAEMQAEMRKRLQAKKQEMVSGEHADMGKAVDLRALAGSYEDLLERLTAAVNPANPFASADRYAYVGATYADHCKAYLYENGEGAWYDVAYSQDTRGNVSLGAIAVGEGPESKTVVLGPERLADHSQLVSAYAAALAQRTRDLSERRTKEGRMLSQATRKRLGECLDTMRGACDQMQGLLDSTDSAKAEAKATLERLLLDTDLLDLESALMLRA